MSDKGASIEVSGRHEKHTIEKLRKGDRCHKVAKTWPNYVLVFCGK